MHTIKGQVAVRYGRRGREPHVRHHPGQFRRALQRQHYPDHDGFGAVLLAITREILDSRTLAISFFGSLKKLVNLFVSSLCAQSGLNLEQKAEEALMLFSFATKPANDITWGVNWDFSIAASLPIHCVLLDLHLPQQGQASPILCSNRCDRF